ncbi:MAG: D-tagatose 3-epimerase [Planctomycetaceae bacterium]|nr:D-tagatose 3-epimerase [Planctomycetaceae bacterium]
MKIAICNETFQNWPLDKAFRYARELGYEGIEFAPFTLGKDATEVSAEKRQEVCELLKKYQLDSIGVHWLLAKTTGYYLTSPDPTVRDRTTEYFIQLAQLCHDLGGKVMVLGSPDQRNLLDGVTHDQALEYAADVIRGTTQDLQRLGVVIALEPLGPAEGNFLLTAESGIQLAKMIDSPNVRLHLDVKAMSSETKPIPEIIHASADYLEHFHTNDANKQGPGMGDIDFVPILQALNDINYQGWLSVEVFDYEPGVERLASESINYLKSCLDAVSRS